MASSALISRSIAWTRSRLESVKVIEPESSMIASMFVAFVTPRPRPCRIRSPRSAPR